MLTFQLAPFFLIASALLANALPHSTLQAPGSSLDVLAPREDEHAFAHAEIVARSATSTITSMPGGTARLYTLNRDINTEPTRLLEGSLSSLIVATARHRFNPQNKYCKVTSTTPSKPTVV